MGRCEVVKALGESKNLVPSGHTGVSIDAGLNAGKAGLMSIIDPLPASTGDLSMLHAVRAPCIKSATDVAQEHLAARGLPPDRAQYTKCPPVSVLLDQSSFLLNRRLREPEAALSIRHQVRFMSPF